MTCTGQFRAGPTGHPTGLDMAAAIEVMNIQKCKTPEVLELVTTAESEIVKAISEKN